VRGPPQLNSLSNNQRPLPELPGRGPTPPRQFSPKPSGGGGGGGMSLATPPEPPLKNNQRRNQNALKAPWFFSINREKAKGLLMNCGMKQDIRKVATIIKLLKYFVIHENRHTQF
jgi:hypothetical protein